MEFWGVEVKSGQSLHVDPGEDMLVHISQVALAENKKNENDTIRLFVKVGEQKLIIGTLSHEKIPQLATEIVLEKGFELSHSWRNGSVFFTGYKVDASDPEDDDMNNDDPAVAREQAASKQVNFKLPNEDAKDESDDESDEDSSDDDSEEESEDEEEKKVTAEVGNDEDDDEDDSSDSDEEEDDDSSDDEDTPKKAEESKKRPSAEANTSKSSTSNKKAKFVTPEKTAETKKPHVHVATPYPTKGKNSGSNGEASKQTPKSGGSFGCKSCNRSFGSEMGLQSHTKAKHSAAA